MGNLCLLWYLALKAGLVRNFNAVLALNWSWVGSGFLLWLFILSEQFILGVQKPQRTGHRVCESECYGMAQQEVEDLAVQLELNMEVSSLAQGVKLVGAALVNRPLNRWGVRNILRASWKDLGEIEVKWVRDNLYIISVPDDSVATRIVSQVPWAVMKQNFSVCRWPVELALEEVQVEFLPFWIQIRGIPLGLTSESNVRWLVRDVGTFLELEDLSKARGFVRVRVVVNSKNPLIPGCWLSRGQDTETWVEFKYERLQDFCYRCGRIGHANTECSFEPQKGHAAGYGEWTKAAPIRDVVPPTKRVASGAGEHRVAGAVRQSRRVVTHVGSQVEPLHEPGEGIRGAGRIMQSESPLRSSGEPKKWRRKGRSGGEHALSVQLHPVAVSGILDNPEASPVSYHSSFGGSSAGTVEEMQGGDIGEKVASPVKRGSLEAVGEPSQVSLKKIKIVTNPLEVCDVLEVGVENERVDLLDRNKGISSIGGGGWPSTAARSP
ncbi:hypothetical protein ACFX1T_009646 [Malus domestica]